MRLVSQAIAAALLGRRGGGTAAAGSEGTPRVGDTKGGGGLEAPVALQLLRWHGGHGDVPGADVPDVEMSPMWRCPPCGDGPDAHPLVPPPPGDATPGGTAKVTVARARGGRRGPGVPEGGGEEGNPSPPHLFL